ncbi:MAG: L,D-transpeptidase family protein [Methylocystaceae bacterium]
MVVYASRFLRLAEPPMDGPDVLEVQKRLKELGYKVNPTGIYDVPTDAAVREFQTNTGLMVDGIVGPDTWNMLTTNFPMPMTRIKVGEKQQPNKVYRIAIDVIQTVLTLRLGNDIVATFPVAVGKPQTPTPLGDWKIVFKSMNPGGAFGARWMRLSVPFGGYGIHGTNNPPSIGTAASHGCVRMFNEDVIKLYDLVPVGTIVKIFGSANLGRLLTVGVAPGYDVTVLQQSLAILGYYPYDIDSYYGPQTEAAVKKFQQDNGLAPDGIVGPQTYELLQERLDIASGNQEP